MSSLRGTRTRNANKREEQLFSSVDLLVSGLDVLGGECVGVRHT